jgi:hypothetical protein
MADVGVLLPVRIETRFKNGDLWIRVVPDEPWFVREDPRVTKEEVDALRTYLDAPSTPGADAVPPAWRAFAAEVGAPRAVYLHRTFVTMASDGTRTIRTPAPAETRDAGPVLPRIVGFPKELTVWLSDARGARRAVLQLAVKTERLLADFADPDIPGDRRWWEDWNEAVAVGVAGIIPAANFDLPIDALYVTGLGHARPGDLLARLAAEGRIGLVDPGTPTNSVDGAPAAPLGNDPDTWWTLLQSSPGPGDADVSRALTGDPNRLSNLPGGTRPQRAQASSVVTAMWAALWGFAATQVFNVARGVAAARWAGAALFPEGAYPIVRIGSQPYGLLPTTAWTTWRAAEEEPPVERTIVASLLKLRPRHAAGARGRGTVAGKTTDQLLELFGDTPTSSRFRFRLAWPLELWWLGMVASGVPRRWRTLERAWGTRYALAEELALDSMRRYGSVGQSRRIGIPLVLPTGVDPTELPGLLDALAAAAITQPAAFANTAHVEETVLGGRGASLLLRLAIRSLQLSIAELGRLPTNVRHVLLEPFSRRSHQRGRLEQLIASVSATDIEQPGDAAQQVKEVARSLSALAAVPIGDLERMLAATIDCSTHRIDPWLVGPVQRRLDHLHASNAAELRLGAYGWVDGPAPGTPGPTTAGLVQAPSAAAALTAAVLRDHAIHGGDGRWDLDITSKTARIADRLANQVRAGAHLPEVLGREIERIVGKGVDIERLRRDFPVRTEHAGRRVCDGMRILAEPTFPVPIDVAQASAVEELRAGVDAYADLLVADAVNHLIGGRSEAAGAAMEGAAGLNRPPELNLLRTTREGRAVSTSVVLAVGHVASAPLPAADVERGAISPAATLDPSAAAFIAANVGEPGDWTFDVVLSEGLADERRRTISLADLDLSPADALTLTRTKLEALAARRAASLEGVAGEANSGSARVIGGSATAKYERAATLVEMIGRTPANIRTLSEDPVSAGEEAIGADVVARYLAVRAVGLALARRIRAEVERFAPGGGIGTAQPESVEQLLVACTRWGIAPDPPLRSNESGAPPLAGDRLAVRLVDRALAALAQLEERLTKAPDDAAAARLSPTAFVEAAAALVSPTGQVAFTASIRADQLPRVQKADGARDLDRAWLTVVAAVRQPLARLEAHQLTAPRPLVAWATRPDDPWQTDASNPRRLVVVYAVPALDLAAISPERLVAVAVLDRFSEVIPSAEQTTGAAFGFDAPAARAQQAILLAVPPDLARQLDQDTLAQILIETRELAHARMARPVDLDDAFRGLVPTALVPASGTVAIPLERRS